MQQDMVNRFVAHPGGGERYPQIILDLRLPDVFGKALRSQRILVANFSLAETTRYHSRRRQATAFISVVADKKFR
jgi:hypothetical protein